MGEVAKENMTPACRKISVAVPAYNEAVIIEDTTRQIEACLKSLEDRYSWEVLLIDDGSTDATGEKMDALSNEHIRVIHHDRNYGRGHGIKTAFRYARGDIIITLDADLSYSVEHIPRLLEHMEETGADIVSASPYRSGGKVENVPLFRLLLSWVGNKLLSFSMGGGFTVITCIVRAYKSSVIKSLDLFADGKELHPEILLKARILGYQVDEIPATLRWSDAKVNKSKTRRRSKFKLKGTVASHLFILFYSRPNLLFSLPGMLLLIYGLSGVVALAYRIFQYYAMNQMPFHENFPLAIRLMIDNYTPSLIISGLSLLFGFQFLILGFLSIQNKKNFEELYRLIARGKQVGK